MIPYSVIGIDFAGPFLVRGHDLERPAKTFALVISCFYSRHITTILCRTATTADVIMALRELVSIRGCFKLLYLDSAKAFLKSALEMRRLLSKINFHELRPSFDKWDAEFVFSTPRAAHTNGANEIAVAAVSYTHLTLPTILLV